MERRPEEDHRNVGRRGAHDRRRFVLTFSFVGNQGETKKLKHVAQKAANAPPPAHARMSF